MTLSNIHRKIWRPIRAYIRYLIWLRFVDGGGLIARREARALGWTSLPLPPGWWKKQRPSVLETAQRDASWL